MEMLDYEGATKQEINDVIKRFQSFWDSYISPNRTMELHHGIVKPTLGVERNHQLLEIGVGKGYHLRSYVGFNYCGVDIDSSSLEISRYCAELFSIPKERILERDPSGSIPIGDSKIDRLFSVCTLHETEDIEAELSEMDRLIKDDGQILIVERLCAISESESAKRNLKREPKLLPEWFGDHGYMGGVGRFKATYYGESLAAEPQFNYFFVIAEKK
jgi:ubiquinone/menaquinone biosynthesis C-methylase UbiE